MRINIYILLLLVSTSTFAQIPNGYYDNAEGKKGEELKTALYNIIQGHTEYSYTSTSTDTWDILKEADKDPNNSANVIGIYSGFSMDGEAEYASGSGWSREHVWAKSRGDFGTSNGAGTDCHHLRAEDVSTNSARSNRNFDECSDPYTDASGTYNGATESFTSSTEFVWKPRAEVKGDVARMIFYMATRYEGENGEPDLELTETLQDQSSTEPLHAKLSTLISWHLEDPVSEEERNRNDIIYSYQNNRNPFIDHPEYVECIWINFCEHLLPDIDIDSYGRIQEFEPTLTGTESASQNFGLTGTNLENGVTVTSSENFIISSDDENFGSSLSFEIGEATAGVTIYVKFVPNTGIDQYIQEELRIETEGVLGYQRVSGTETTQEIQEAQIIISSLNHTYDGTEKEVIVTTSPNVQYEILYDGSINAPINAGSYDVTVTIDDDDYYGQKSETLVIEKASATIELTDLEQDYDGTPKSITVTTDPEGVNTEVVYGDTTNPPTEVGSYTVLVTIEDANYVGESELVVMTIHNVTGMDDGKVDDVFVYPNPAQKSLSIKGGRDEPIYIIDVTGKLYHLLPEIDGTIDVSNLPNGVYTIKVGLKFIRVLIE